MYCTASVDGAFNCCDRMWFVLMEANMCFSSFVYVCIAVEVSSRDVWSQARARIVNVICRDIWIFSMFWCERCVFVLLISVELLTNFLLIKITQPFCSKTKLCLDLFYGCKHLSNLNEIIKNTYMYFQIPCFFLFLSILRY